METILITWNAEEEVWLATTSDEQLALEDWFDAKATDEDLIEDVKDMLRQYPDDDCSGFTFKVQR